MNWLGKMFKKKKKGYNTDGQYKLLVIDENAELLHQNLGITDERAEQLLDVCDKAYREYKSLHDALSYMVDKCTHTNEIVFASLLMQSIIDRENSKGRFLNYIKSMFGNG